MAKKLSKMKSADKGKMFLTIKAVSSGFEGANVAQISIDDEMVAVKPTVNNHDRGLHIVIINQGTGLVE